MSCAGCDSVLAWLRPQEIASTVIEVRLPPELAHLAANGTVAGLRLPDGRVCVLLKTSLGWKDNFEGVFCADGPLLPTEIVGAGTARAYISIGDGYMFQELYIRRQFSDRCFAVYFDLN